MVLNLWRTQMRWKGFVGYLGTCLSNAKTNCLTLRVFSIRSRKCRWLVAWKATENFHDGAR